MKDQRPLKKSGSKSKAQAGEMSRDSSLVAQASSLPLVAVIMGSTSDWETMRHAADVLTRFDVAHECLVVSAHRTPAWMAEFA
ncbi:MAG: AIR carboxylase family protein, partial [Pyrinomonadaceae bacterium]